MQHAGTEAAFANLGACWRELLPWRRFSIATTWSPEVATIELAKRVGRRAHFLEGDPAPPFVGSFAGARFRFSRRIAYRNSFLPVIAAEIYQDPRGARVEIAMRLRLFVLVFMAVWMTGATCGAMSGLALLLARGMPQGLVFVLLPLAGGLLSGVAFAHEARRAEILLRASFPPVLTVEGLPPYR